MRQVCSCENPLGVDWCGLLHNLQDSQQIDNKDFVVLITKQFMPHNCCDEVQQKLQITLHGGVLMPNFHCVTWLLFRLTYVKMQEKRNLCMSQDINNSNFPKPLNFG